MAGKFALSFPHNLLSISVHISGSIRPITLIWVLLERSFPPAAVGYRWCEFWSKVMTSEVAERPRFVRAVYDPHRNQRDNNSKQMTNAQSIPRRRNLKAQRYFYDLAYRPRKPSRKRSFSKTLLKMPLCVLVLTQHILKTELSKNPLRRDLYGGYDIVLVAKEHQWSRLRIVTFTVLEEFRKKEELWDKFFDISGGFKRWQTPGGRHGVKRPIRDIKTAI